jgi:hypothetical protein
MTPLEILTADRDEWKRRAIEEQKKRMSRHRIKNQGFAIVKLYHKWSDPKPSETIYKFHREGITRRTGIRGNR